MRIIRNKKMDKPVTTAIFEKEMERVDQQFKKINQRFEGVDQAISSLALSHVRLETRVERIENTMATKEDVRLILDRLDSAIKRADWFQQKALFHDHRLRELNDVSVDHEKRIHQLETKRG